MTAGKKHLSNGDFLAGHQFEYAYDDIGNRTSSKSGGDSAGANLRNFGYTADGKNQYTALTYPASFDIIGRTPVAAGDSVTSTLGTATRQGEHYRVQGTAGNSTDADWKASDVTYTPASGPATTESGHVFIPEAAMIPIYDADGNLTTDGRWTYVWDAENRLVSMTSLHNDKPRTRKLEFAYDWMGRRIEKKVSDEISSVMTVVDKRRFAYDRWNMIAEFTVDGSGNLAADRQYTWGTDLSGSEQGAGGVGGLLSVSNNGTPLIACYDGNGNIVAWMNSGGAAAGRNEYDPFGNRIIQEGVEIPVGFSTKYEDKEVGLLYYGYRYYDPKSGRSPSRDPIGEDGGINLYRFLSNDGVNALDYLGLNAADSGQGPWFEIEIKEQTPKRFLSKRSRKDNEIGWSGDGFNGRNYVYGATNVDYSNHVLLRDGGECCIDKIDIFQKQIVRFPHVGDSYDNYDIDLKRQGWIFKHEYMGHAVPNNILAEAVWKSVQKCRGVKLNAADTSCKKIAKDIEKKITEEWGKAIDKLADDFHSNVEEGGKSGELDIAAYQQYIKRVNDEANKLERTNFCKP